MTAATASRRCIEERAERTEPGEDERDDEDESGSATDRLNERAVAEVVEAL